MLRPLIATSLIGLLVGCQTAESHYTRASLRLESGAVNVFVHGKSRGDSRHPCPPQLGGSARVNGIVMDVVEDGTEQDYNDSDELDCGSLWYRLDIAQLPLDTTELDITFQDLTHENRPYTAASSWHIRADWPHTHVWAEGSLARSMNTREPFVVRWEPADDPMPDLQPVAFTAGHWRSDMGAPGIELVDSEAGSARFRFVGTTPNALWNVTASRVAALENTAFEGFSECEFDGSADTVALYPVGIPPVRPDGVAPPRECIGAPDAPARYNYSPSWQAFPELSMVHLEHDASCDGADLYFVLLGACSQCGPDGSDATFVVGNRGTRAADFRVRSNTQTVTGGALQPGELSAGFAVQFDGAVSEIAIVNDDECDDASNVEWVARTPPSNCP